MTSKQQVQTGIDVLLDQTRGIAHGPTVGLITNQSAVTSSLVPTVDALLGRGVRVTALFAPEHGIRGDAADGEAIPSGVDPKTGVPVLSLFGETKKPTSEMLDGLDMLLFDVQDVGARFYTFLYTMALAMQACAEAGKPFVVLDRPNPIGGTAVEGPVLEPEFASFVGLYPIPVRYGMTIGETAMLFNSEFGIRAKLEVVPLRGWRREMWFDQTGLAWIPPSPAMPTIETTAVYSGTCLLEGTNVSEGRGTAAPFQTIGASWIDGSVLADHLNESKLPGVGFSPTRFVPAASKFAGEECEGVFVQVIDRDKFRPVITGLKLVETIRRRWIDKFAFREPSADGRGFFDLLAGTDRVRRGLEAGRSAEEIASSWDADRPVFGRIRKKHLLYTC